MKNPIVQGWYADPESRVYQDRLYLYVTKSLPFEKQTNLDLIVSDDLEHFRIVPDILETETYAGAYYATWAPSVVEKNGKYYIIFAANTIHHDGEPGGLYIGVSDTPEGKFRNVFSDGRPFLNRFYNGAQPIDAHFYKEDDQVYLYYGGWGHLNVGKLNETMDAFVPFEMNGERKPVLEITPQDYVEAPCVLRRGETYILMYSSGGWVNGTYCVKTAVSDSPIGPFVYRRDVLRASEIADGPGHNSEFAFRGKQYVSYHRRYIGDNDPHHRVLCIDEMTVTDNGIEPITMT